MKAKFTESYFNPREVTLEYDDYDGERRTRTFYCGSGSGAYIFEDGHRQVCDALGNRGSTLMMGDQPLIEVIRREYRAMRRLEKIQ